MVYNISDRITLGGMEIFLESILLMKNVSIKYNISCTEDKNHRKNNNFHY